MDWLKDKLFGASWGVTLLGYAIAFLTELDLVVSAGGMPTTWAEWRQAIIGVLVALFGRFTKQANITNAQRPVESQKVPADAPAATDVKTPPIPPVEK